MNKIVEWFWRLLPDKCEMPGCSRRGVRGNENLLDGKVVCDYCHHKYWLAPEHRPDAEEQ